MNSIIRGLEYVVEIFVPSLATIFDFDTPQKNRGL
jgi:hypothetical protein